MTVRAAGVVLFRRSESGLRFLLLRNSRHGTWGFPKGHAEAGESLVECAEREVAEETGGLGYALVPGFEEVTRYRVPADSGGHEKSVHYFLGEADTAEVRLSEEHSDVAWATLDDGLDLLQHASSRDVLTAAASFVQRDQR